MNELKIYLENIVDLKYKRLDNCDLYEFTATFGDYDKNIELYVGENNLKFLIELECPICNLDVFTSINLFNNNCELFKACHDGADVLIECVSFYSDIVSNVKDILDELMTDDYEYVIELIKTIDKNNKIDKVELFENVLSILNEGKNNE